MPPHGKQAGGYALRTQEAITGKPFEGGLVEHGVGGRPGDLATDDRPNLDDGEVGSGSLKLHVVSGPEVAQLAEKVTDGEGRHVTVKNGARGRTLKN